MTRSEIVCPKPIEIGILYLDPAAQLPPSPVLISTSSYESTGGLPKCLFRYLGLYVYIQRLYICLSNYCQPSDQVIIRLPEYDADSWRKNADRHLPAILSQLVLHPVRHLLAPIEDKELWNNHVSFNHQGPDFGHSVHVPRFRGKREPLAEGKLDTEPHLVRCYDLMTMATRGWDEINVFIANAFANFGDYSVLWYVMQCM